MTAVVIGKDSKFCAELEALLKSQSLRVVLLADAAKAPSRVQAEKADLVVVAGGDLPLLQSLRSREPLRRIPILCVNPAGSASEVVATLDAGADDFLAKPFNGQIFLARVRTLIRRQIWSGAAQEEPLNVLEAGGLSLHLVERVLRAGGSEVILTRLEFDLLTHMVRHRGEALKRQELLEAVWKYPADVETRTLDKHVETLRRKLGPLGKHIRTVHGIGYRFMDPDASLAV